MNKKGLCAGTMAAVMLCAMSANGEVAPVQRELNATPTTEPTHKIKPTAEPTIEPTVTPSALPTESPEDLAEEEYYDSLEELAICVEAEAGNQGLLGKRMVVDVILNRVDDPDWPDSIQEVIEQKYQFASFWNGAMERTIPTEETYKAVNMELKERSYPGLLYFTAEGYGDYGTPWKKVGDHYFCIK